MSNPPTLAEAQSLPLRIRVSLWMLCGAALGLPVVEVLLRLDDLVLARPPLPEHLSLSNRFTGTVQFITVSSARCIVGVDNGATKPVLAEVAERAIRHLAVQAGDRILVLVKAQAVQARVDITSIPGITVFSELHV